MLFTGEQARRCHVGGSVHRGKGVPDQTLSLACNRYAMVFPGGREIGRSKPCCLHQRGVPAGTALYDTGESRHFPEEAVLGGKAKKRMTTAPLLGKACR